MTGADIVRIARTRVGQRYVLGAKVPKDDASWFGPWDCAELASWAVYQATGRVVGCFGTDPGSNAFSGQWSKVGAPHERVSVDAALGIPGAILVRAPGEGGTGGHVAISCGDGNSIEAYSTARGVIETRATGRRWDLGVLVADVAYDRVVSLAADRPLLRLRKPRDTGPEVVEVQRIVGVTPDGVYGPDTEAAVVKWQAAHGLVADGEVGPDTWAAMGLS